MNLVPARIIASDSGLYLNVEGKFKIPIPAKADAAIKAEMDVIMGLRPEDLAVDNQNGRIPEEWKVEGIVEVVEPLGSEIHMHMDIYGLKFLAISEGRRIVNQGDKIILAMNLAHLHIFDAETKLSIY
jgi:multiple sugar transport system ATP-binding protein